MNNPHLIIIDDRKEVWLGIKALSEAFSIDATYENPDLIYQNWRDVMTPSLQELLWKVNGEAIVLIDPDFLSGIQDEMEEKGIDESKKILKHAKLVVISGAYEEEALNDIPEYKKTILFFRQKLDVELPWLTKPIGVNELGQLMGKNLL